MYKFQKQTMMQAAKDYQGNNILNFYELNYTQTFSLIQKIWRICKKMYWFGWKIKTYGENNKQSME